MEVKVHNPGAADGIYPADDYVHAVSVSGATRTLYVAGTMGLKPDWSAAAGIDEQLELIWHNIRAILVSAGMTVDNIVRLTSYLRDPAYMEKNAKARLAALGGRKIPTTAIVAQTLSADWLVEIEVIAVA